MSAAMTERGQAKAMLTVTAQEALQAAAVDRASLDAAVPPELAEILAQVMRIVAAGGEVTIGAMPSELTTTTAADMLDISRPTLMKLVRSGEIPGHKVGTHTRLKTDDVIAYRDRIRSEQRAAFDELRSFEDSEGLDY